MTEQDECTCSSCRMKYVLEFQKKLKQILTTNNPSDWPSANWIYEQLLQATDGADASQLPN